MAKFLQAKFESLAVNQSSTKDYAVLDLLQPVPYVEDETRTACWNAKRNPNGHHRSLFKRLI